MVLTKWVCNNQRVKVCCKMSSELCAPCVKKSHVEQVGGETRQRNGLVKPMLMVEGRCTVVALMIKRPQGLSQAVAMISRPESL